MMKMQKHGLIRKVALRAVIASGAVLASVRSHNTSAATLTWKGGGTTGTPTGGNWSSSSSWTTSGGSGVPANGDTLVFGGSGSTPYTSTNDQSALSVAPALITLNSTASVAETITGGTLGDTALQITQSNSGAFKFDTSVNLKGLTLILDGNGTGVVTYGGTLQGSSNGKMLTISKAGSSTVVLTGSATSFVSTLNISGGTFRIGAGGTSGSLSGTAAITNTATLSISRSDVTTFANTMSGSGGVLNHDGSGVTTFTGSNSYTGGTNINSGTAVAGHANAFGTSGTITVANGATFAVGSGVSFTRALSLSSGAKLGGIGTYTPGSTLTVASGTYVAPGISDGTNNVGKLTIGNSVTFQSGSQLTIDLDFTNVATATADQLVMTGASNTMTIGGTLYLNVLSGAVGPLGTTKTFTIIDNQSNNAISGNFANIIPANAGNFLYTFTKTGGTGNDFTVSITSVPEPTSTALLALASSAALARRRVRRK